MLKIIDRQLNKITMYRLVLYYLILLVAAAFVLSLTHVLAFNPFALLLSTSFLLAVCTATNWVFARIYGVPTNIESSYITALILALIITPLQGYNDLWFLGWAAVLAMASKYILAIKAKHVFNPVAIAAAITYFATNQSASWWVGDASMLFFVLVGGLVMVRKVRRFDLVLSFILTALAATLVSTLFNGQNLFTGLERTVLYSPILFFASVMITEPLTTPPTRKLRIIYGAIVGFFFTPLFHLGTFYTTPELALLIGNVYSYIVSPKTKLILHLKDRTRLAPDVYEFVFSLSRKLAFEPGQYMEWTLGHADPDSRGNRRYFTMASAPTEHTLKLGVKFYPQSSSYKKAMLGMRYDQEIIASQIAGDFVLPDNPRQKIVFIAGGIGITPFRSMIKYLLDTHQRRPVTIFYSNRCPEEVVYQDVFDRAERELGIKTIYTITDRDSLSPTWKGKVGRIDADWIKKAVPGFRSHIFYISGPVAMVEGFTETLHQLGVKSGHIKTDYFSGLA